jgi:dTDP-4-amino-4,6-dideoxygalactose transaminase
MKLIPYGRQHISNQDIRFVSKALKEDLITTGRYVKKFENKISRFLEVKYTATCNSGTSALHLALIAIGLEKDDVIIMPAINFIAVYNMARLMNAKIFLADVDPLTGQMTPKALLDCIKNNKLTKVKAIITMYLAGHPENILEFYNIKKKLNCFLIEDACHAFGSKYNFNNSTFYVGSCKHSDIAVFSFHPLKTITTAEGGAITTNNKSLAKKIFLSRSHGILRRSNFHWKHDVSSVGFNYRLSDINCALGLSQLKNLNKFINYRKKIYFYYKKKFDLFTDLIKFPIYNPFSFSSYHLFLINIDFKKIGLDKNDFFLFLKKKNIILQYHYIPLYKFSNFYEKNIKLINSEKYYQNTVSLPIFYKITKKDVDKICKFIYLFISKKKF